MCGTTGSQTWILQICDKLIKPVYAHKKPNEFPTDNLFEIQHWTWHKNQWTGENNVIFVLKLVHPITLSGINGLGVGH